MLSNVIPNRHNHIFKINLGACLFSALSLCLSLYEPGEDRRPRHEHRLVTGELLARRVGHDGEVGGGGEHDLAQHGLLLGQGVPRRKYVSYD